MPTSRSRRTRNRSNSDRKRERLRKARAERTSHDELSMAQTHAQQFEADRAAVLESAHAAAEGDLDKAFELYDAVPALAGSTISRGMRQLRELGDDAPPWAWSRWIQEQAFLWASPTNERRFQLALELAIEVAHPTGVDPDGVPVVLARDWIVRQMVLHELGGLDDFVENVAGEELLTRADPMLEWRCAPMGAYQFVDETPECTRLLDMETEDHVEVLNIGSLGAVEPGGFVLGRLVPNSSGPGLMFESAPLEVDERTATQFAERWESEEAQMQADDCGCVPDECDGFNCEPYEWEPPKWWEVLQDACYEERVPALFSLHLEYPLLTDVPGQVWRSARDDAPDSELVEDLVRAGTSRAAAEAVQVAVHALASAPVYGKGLAAGGPIYGAVLLEPGVMEVLTERFTLPQHAQCWRALAELVVEPARKRCMRLAEACDEHRER